MLGQSFIVGGGIQAGATFTLNHYLWVSNVNPAQAQTGIPIHATDSISGFEYVGIPTSAGVYPTVTNATESLRISGGMIVSGAGTDSVLIGRASTAAGSKAIAIGQGAVASNANTVAIGTGASATANDTIVIGASTNNGNSGVVVGAAAGFNGTGGVAIGNSAVLNAGAGSAVGTAIGQNAQANFQASGNSLVIGVGARAVTGDTVVGDAASSSTDSVFGVFNVVIGNLAAANIAGGNVFAVVVGASASSAQKLATVIGSGATATVAGQTRAIVIGSGAHANTTDAIVIGGGSTLTSKSISIGAGAAEIGVGTFQLGAPSTPITTFIFGEGNTKASSAGRAFRFTNAVGTDNGANNFTFIAPLSTGAATPATIIFQVGAVGASGTTLQTATTVLTIGDQVMVTPGSFDAASFKVGGVAGASFGPGAITNLTVVNGIVTAAS